MNFLLPREMLSPLYQALFDRNKNRQLEPQEVQQMGHYFAKTLAWKQAHISLDSQLVTLKLLEVQNSRIRGNFLKKQFAWDFHWSVLLSSQQLKHLKKKKINIVLPTLFPKEVVHVGIRSLDFWEFTHTSSSLPDKTKQKAVCRIHAQQKQCQFRFLPKRNLKTKEK